MDNDDWGYAYYADGSSLPLQPPPTVIPEDEREIIVDRPGLVMWTRKSTDEAKGIDMDERGPRERLKDQLARVHGYQNYETAHDAARQVIEADAEEILFRRQQRTKGSTPPPLNTPRLGDPINAECSYVKRTSSINQAAHWNAILTDDPIYGPACGLLVGVAPVKDSDGRYPLVWVANEWEDE